MNFEEKLQDNVSKRIWNDYFIRVNKVLKSLDQASKEEIILELKSHLFSSIENDNSSDEPTRILNAIGQLGEPEEFLKPIVADKLLSQASKSFNPANIFQALFYNVFYTTFRRAMISLVLFTVYLVSIILLVTVVSKIFIPESVGLFVYESGAWLFGVDFPEGGWRFGVNTLENGQEGHARELLGYWLIPLGVGISVMLLYTVRKLSNLLVKKQE